MIYCPALFFFSINTDIAVVKVHFSLKLGVWGRCLFSFHLLFVNGDSICFSVGGGSFLFSAKASNNDPQSRFVHFLSDKYMDKKTHFPVSLLPRSYILMAMIHWPVQASLYIQDNGDFPFSQFFLPLIFPLTPNRSFNATTQYGELCLATFFFFYFLSCPAATTPEGVDLLGNC